MIDLKSHFSSKIKSYWGKDHVEAALEMTLRTDIGKALIETFHQSGGKIRVTDKGTKLETARACYLTGTNSIILSEHATSTDLIHELAHARQYRKEPRSSKADFSILEEAHFTTIIEADAWALSGIYWKEFLSLHPSSHDFFLKEESLTFHHLFSVYPKLGLSMLILLSGDGLADNLESDLKQRILSEIEKQTEELYDPGTDLKWAGTIFKACCQSQSEDGRNSYNYIEDLLQEAADYLLSIGASDIEGINFDKFDYDFSSLVQKFSDLSDIGIPGSYLTDHDTNGTLPEWAVKPDMQVLARFREIYEPLRHERRANQAGINVGLDL